MAHEAEHHLFKHMFVHLTMTHTEAGLRDDLAEVVGEGLPLAGAFGKALAVGVFGGVGEVGAGGNG